MLAHQLRKIRDYLQKHSEMQFCEVFFLIGYVLSLPFLLSETLMQTQLSSCVDYAHQILSTPSYDILDLP